VGDKMGFNGLSKLPFWEKENATRFLHEKEYRKIE
jgi:hypothetical protein